MLIGTYCFTRANYENIPSIHTLFEQNDFEKFKRKIISSSA